MSNTALLASFALGLTPALRQPALPQVDLDAVYRLRIEAKAPRILHIDAELPCADGRLTLGEFHPEAQQRWSGFVDDLEATTLGGEALPVTKPDGNLWTLADPRPERVRLRYRLRLEHDLVRWPPSNAEGTYVRDDCVFFRAYAVLIGNRASERTRIVLDLPEDWQVTTPLASTPEAPREFTSDVRFDAFNTGFMLGRHAIETIELGGIQVHLGVSHDLPGALEVMVDPFRTALVAAKQVFGGELESRYAIIAAASTSLSGSGGSGLSNGMSMLLGRNPVDDPGGLWAFTLTHELMHMWLSSLIRCGSEMQWFNEGLCDYLALVIGGQNGLYRDSVELGYMSRMWSGYQQLAGNRSLASAGTEKSRYYNFIYGGGMNIGLLLELELRRATDGKHTLATLLQAINREFGGTGRYLTTPDVLRLASQLAGEDLGWIFDDFVLGEVPLPSELVHEPLGLREETLADGSVRLVADPHAEAKAVALRKTILGID
jgi:predicted metalloprotease with PDZ domain